MNKKTLILIFLSISSVHTHAMELLPVKRKRAVSQPNPKPHVPQKNKQTKKSYIEPSLSIILRQEFFSWCSVYLRLNVAAKVVNALAQVDTSWNIFVNDDKRTLQLIKQFSQQYSCLDIDVVRVLRTKAANHRLALQRAFFYGDCSWDNFIISDAQRLKNTGLNLDFTYKKDVPTALLNIMSSSQSWACIRDKYDKIAQWIIENGADINIATASEFRWVHILVPAKQTASLLALRFFRKSLIPELLRHQAFKVDYQDDNNDTPLHCCFYGLKDHRTGQNFCDYNCQRDVMQRAPFVYSIVQELLKKGANPTVVNKDGRTPLMLAQESGYQPLIDLLEKAVAEFEVIKK
jgi:hypothetical protein